MLPNFRKPDTDTQKTDHISSATAPQSAPPPPTPRSPGPSATRAMDRGAPSIIGPDLSITGNLVSKGEIQIDGEVQGDIRSTHVMVGERALITGSIAAEEVVIRGKVMGSVRGKRVLLQNSSHVEGDIYHQALAIEQGAFFEGKSRRSSEPLADSAAQSAQAPGSPPSPPTSTTSASSAATSSPNAPPPAPPSGTSPSSSSSS